MRREAVRLPDSCPACGAPGHSLTCLAEIPHFKEIVIMAFNCESCGFKSSEVMGCFLSWTAVIIAVAVTAVAVCFLSARRHIDICNLLAPFLLVHVELISFANFRPAVQQ